MIHLLFDYSIRVCWCNQQNFWQAQAVRLLLMMCRTATDELNVRTLFLLWNYFARGMLSYRKKIWIYQWTQFATHSFHTDAWTKAVTKCSSTNRCLQSKVHQLILKLPLKSSLWNICVFLQWVNLFQ